MEFEQIACESTDSGISQFWRAIAVWLKNPHVINRRILASRELLAVQINCDVTDIFERIERLSILPDYFERDHSTENQEHLLDILNITEHCVSLPGANLIEGPNSDGVHLRVKNLLPRNTRIFSPTLEFVFVDGKSASVTSFHKCIIHDKRSLGPNVTYSVQYHEYGTVCINASKSGNYGESREWLRAKLLPRLTKWMTENENNAGPRKIDSLGLVPAEEYAALYNRLKEKYGAEMVRRWPENTDPAKFVYEDVAIATYLLLLWERERRERNMQKLQSFIDLGCGNGLLVYILSSEGHAGTGIDLRRRKIWDLYPNGTHLQVDTIVPSSDTVYPGIDWIIGNHSDELTPWIPVIAARSSYECRFFLLPCCPYEFDGRKYRRHNAAESQYSEYMSYVKNVCEGCGFHTLTDKLRIPSTKRICFVGWRRSYAREDSAALDADIRTIIHARSTSTTEHREEIEVAEDSNLWSESFKPRSPMERPRNCTQLDRKLIFDIVNMVALQLLRTERRISLERRPGKTWNAGRRIGIGEIAKLIAPEMLRQLRNECGGLQTLLKNHNHIFYVARGEVQFQIPGSNILDKKKRMRSRKGDIPVRKVKPCWFHHNHPDGCPVLETDCNFQH